MLTLAWRNEPWATQDVPTRSWATLELAPRHRQPQPRGKVMTLTKVTTAIAKGWGQGRDARYQPWIRIRRRLSSPVSNLFVAFVPLYRQRGLHLLSRLEHDAALISVWLGAKEVREQFPAWPDPHLHPAAGRLSDARFSRVIVPGLREIAREAGIKHGVYPGTNIPFVATIDLMVEVEGSGGTRLVAISCKPRGKMSGPGSVRVLERLKLEDLYCRRAEIGSFTFADDLVSERFCGNLDWFSPLASEVAAFGHSNQLEDFAGEFMRDCEGPSITQCRVRASLKAGLTELEAQHAFFRMAAWRGLIDIDFRQPVIFSRPLRIDRAGFKNQLATQIFGTAQ